MVYIHKGSVEGATRITSKEGKVRRNGRLDEGKKTEKESRKERKKDRRFAVNDNENEKGGQQDKRAFY